MNTQAEIKYLRISPKKMKPLTGLVIGLSPQKAMDRLSFMPGKASQLLSQAIASAKSNAVNNHKMNSNNLKISEVTVSKGPHFKRWRAVARGMAHKIKKPTSHLKVKIEEVSQEKNVKTGKNKDIKENK